MKRQYPEDRSQESEGAEEIVLGPFSWFPDTDFCLLEVNMKCKSCGKVVALKIG